MEPPRRPDVGKPVQKVSQHVIALGVLGILLLAGLIFLFTGREGPGEDRLNDNAVTANVTGEDPEKRCADSANNDRIKRALFARSAEQRGTDGDVFNQIAGFAVLRSETPIVRGYDQGSGSVTCSAYITLDLPPGVVLAGGRRSLSAEVGYRMPGANGAPLELTDAEGIVGSLTGLTREGGAVGDTVEDGIEPPPEAPPEVVAPAEPVPSPSRYPGRPSFDCDDATTRGEIAVCNNPALSQLDVAMASQYRRALADSSPRQRALLIQSRDRFLAYRDNCPTVGCMQDAYQGRMREIRDIAEAR